MEANPEVTTEDLAGFENSKFEQNIKANILFKCIQANYQGHDFTITPN